MTGALRTADILLNLPRPIHWISRDHPRTESANAVSFADWGEQGRCASDARWCRNAPVRKELRNGSNRSEREPTSGRSTNYGSGQRPLAPQRKAPLEKCGAGVKGRELAYPALFGRFSFG